MGKDEWNMKSLPEMPALWKSNNHIKTHTIILEAYIRHLKNMTQTFRASKPAATTGPNTTSVSLVSLNISGSISNKLKI